MSDPIKRTGCRSPFTRAALDSAKARVGISTAWRAYGLPGEPGRVCCSPFRDDRHPSFSISADDRLWHDFATGDGGDVVDFIRIATGCTDREAIRRVLELAGGTLTSPVTLAPRAVAADKPRPAFDGLANLDVQPPTLREVIALAELRAWPLFAGLELAAHRGLLRMADVPHREETDRAWILTDADRKSAQARRLDGEPFARADGSTFKSKTLRADAEHPPGLADVLNANRPVVLIAEGEPDALAALTFAWLADCAARVGVLCLTGASKSIPPAVLKKLRGRRCRVLRQSDKPGKNGVKPSHRAALAWAETLAAAGVAVDMADLDALACANGQPAKDTADLLCRPAELETLEPIAAALLDGLNP
jgi:hypothetical protein